MECPSCRSTDLQRLSVIYNSGLFAVKGHSIGVLDGDLQLHRGTHQSRISQIAAAPKKRSYLRTALIYVLCFYVVGAMISLMRQTLVQSQGHIYGSGQVAHKNEHTGQNNSSATDVWWGILAAIFLALLTILLQRVHRYNRNVYPTLRQKWNSSFMCLRCGAIAEMRT